ncbi:hypothetical protein LCGC14_1518670 [marine sediment metagenome]|uniref:Uncharacterized protein n=1 Tax=marine sediment metagenome TaxID=412755 RepID=A0A0F9IZF9_9ZZZZ
MPQPKHNPANYQRATIKSVDILRALHGRGWTSLTQLTGLLACRIAPENAVRFWQYYSDHRKTQRACCRRRPLPSLAMQVSRGRRTVVLMRVRNLAVKGKVEHRRGSRYQEPFYRLIETNGKDNTDANKAASRKKASP